ncbi:MAG TPA: L-2-hydroxyglutarate oxidase [Verrucomicrobiota bacterium]|nr:L-2-hydroxyglutarate oxidase [Verrucomicrobiota bacterium]HNU50975.1 L-2-hydroxyglutarate oxidase [Verrucomicrobiota bacterium]
MRSVVVIGGGLVGLGTAYRLLQGRSGIAVTLVEKEPSVGMHQSTHNSGVLHAGLYYAPGSIKARLAVAGIRQMIEFCRKEGVPHETCGKLVVATAPEELPRLEELLRRGTSNGLQGLRRLDATALRAVEPCAAGLAAVHVPEEGIVDYAAVCDRLSARIQEGGGRVVTGAKVEQLKRAGAEWAVQTTAGDFTADAVVNCAGLHCDRVAQMAGERREVRIIPFRGEYYTLRASRSSLVRNLIYPVPAPEFPFLGVHFTRRIQGGIEAGPNAVLAFAREGYRRTQVSARDLWDALLFPGFWRFLRRHPAMVRTELAQSLSRKRFCRSLQRLVPDLRADDLTPGGSGVRAQAMTPGGELVQDFRIIERDNALHVLNAPSPAATAALAIGERIAKRLEG